MARIKFKNSSNELKQIKPSTNKLKYLGYLSGLLNTVLLIYILLNNN